MHQAWGVRCLLCSMVRLRRYQRKGTLHQTWWKGVLHCCWMHHCCPIKATVLFARRWQQQGVLLRKLQNPCSSSRQMPEALRVWNLLLWGMQIQRISRVRALHQTRWRQTMLFRRLHHRLPKQRIVQEAPGQVDSMLNQKGFTNKSCSLGKETTYSYTVTVRDTVR